MSTLNLIHTRRNLIICCAVFILMHVSYVLYAQLPPRPIQVTKVADLAFGAFYHGVSGGTVVITSTGSRASTGDVVTLGAGYAPAMFRVKGNPGTLVTPVLGGTITINRSGGGSMTFTLDPATNPVSPFVLPGPLPVNAIVDLYVGGTLTVGSPGSNPPGSYSGTFSVTFTQNYN